jgi:hypothetical protein
MIVEQIYGQKIKNERTKQERKGEKNGCLLHTSNLNEKV